MNNPPISNPIANLAAALVAVQTELPAIPKTRRAKIPTKSGGSFEYTYADLGDIVHACTPILVKHGLAISQLVVRDGLVTMLMHSSGEYITAHAGIPPCEDARTLGAWISYQRRYGYSSILGLVTEEDTDGAGANKDAPQSSAKAPVGRQEAPPRSPAKPPTENRPREGNPGDIIDWEGTTLHFGKHKGKTLGELEPKSIRWFYEEWMPSKLADEKYPPRKEDHRLMDALKAWHKSRHPDEGTEDTPLPDDAPPTPADDDSIPF